MGDFGSAPVVEAGVRWDPLVRITHWGIAVAVLVNGLVTEGGGTIHVWIGYTAFALLAARLVWGVVGTAPARFSSFPPSLAAARTHLADLVAGRHGVHPSHNPLGALMVYALWGTLAVVTVTGIAMAGSPLSARPAGDGAGVVRPLAPGDDGTRDEAREEDDDGEEEGEEVLEEIHEVAANLLLILAALHVGGVGLESWRSRRNLAREMVTGRRAGDPF